MENYADGLQFLDLSTDNKDGITVGRTFASLQNYHIDGNKEMMAIGLMNIVGSFFSCFVTTGSFASSSVNYNAGVQTTVSNIIMAAAVLITLSFLVPLFYWTPNVVLAAMIIAAVIGLIDFQAAFRLWKVDKLDFLACLCSFFSVLLISVPMGLIISVGVSILRVLLHVAKPNTSILGRIPSTQIYTCLSCHKEATREIKKGLGGGSVRLKANNECKMNCLILDMTAVTAIDTTV